MTEEQARTYFLVKYGPVPVEGVVDTSCPDDLIAASAMELFREEDNHHKLIISLINERDPLCFEAWIEAGNSIKELLDQSLVSFYLLESTIWVADRHFNTIDVNHWHDILPKIISLGEFKKVGIGGATEEQAMNLLFQLTIKIFPVFRDNVKDRGLLERMIFTLLNLGAPASMIKEVASLNKKVVFTRWLGLGKKIWPTHHSLMYPESLAYLMDNYPVDWDQLLKEVDEIANPQDECLEVLLVRLPEKKRRIIKKALTSRMRHMDEGQHRGILRVMRAEFGKW